MADKSTIYLEKNCTGFMDLILRLSLIKGDWRKKDTATFSNMDSSTCGSICNYNNLYYLEPNGDTTYVSLKNNFWIDSIDHKKTYSKLSLSWTSKCDFEITFIKSNNTFKNYLSKAGDKYYYRILDKTDSYYLLNTLFNGIWYEFKIYYK